MKKNIQILGIQFLAIIVGGFVLEIFFEMPEWFAVIVSAALLALIFLIIQLKGSMEYPLKDISSDGISGTRIVGTFFTSVMLPFVLGVYNYIIVDVIMILLGIVGLVIGRKYITSFLFKNNWDKKYWFVYLGTIFLAGGVYSIFASTGAAPCAVLSGKYKLVALALFCIVMRGTIPPNTAMAKFVTNNYKNYQDNYTDKD